MVIPKSVTPARIAENFNVWDFRLDKDELGEIAKLDQGKRLGPDPDQFRRLTPSLLPDLSSGLY